MTAYTVYITPRAWDELNALPGNMRQRLRRDITSLATMPRPSVSKALSLPETIAHLAASADTELRRLRIERWRVVYAVSDTDATVDILTIQKCPPYDYGNLNELLAEL